MIRVMIAVGFWGIAVWVAASKFALSVAIPLAILLAALGLEFVHSGMPIRVFLAIVGVLWFGTALAVGFQGFGAMMRDQPDEASRNWTLSISLVGLALTFIVAIQTSQGSLHSIQHNLPYGSSAAAGARGN